jgi:hypothetical protein
MPTLSQQFPGEMLPVRVLPLTQGYVAIVDPEDFALVGGHKWCVIIGQWGPPYAGRRVGGRRGNLVVRMHAVIKGAPGADHVNRIGLDNRRSNLRVATNSENHANSGPHKDNSSGFKGVGFRKDIRKWRAQIKVGDASNKYLGTFVTPEDAARAYDHAAIRGFGEYACTNYALGLVSHDTCGDDCLLCGDKQAHAAGRIL